MSEQKLGIRENQQDGNTQRGRLRCRIVIGHSALRSNRSRTRFSLQHVNPLEKIQGVLSLSEAKTGNIIMNFDLIYILILIFYFLLKI